MVNKSLLVVLSVLMLAMLACSVTINAPEQRIKTGPTQTDEINIAALPSDEVADLRLEFGAGELTLNPGDEEMLVSGTATYNVPDLKPEISEDGNEIIISNGDLRVEGMPILKDYKNEWDLELGLAPMDLTIQAGAYQGDIELGGLSLQSLRVSDGAADVDLAFSHPNQVEMDTLRYETGASQVELTGLANANFSRMDFKGGAGSYVLDFSGELKRDATVSVDAGLSSIKIIVPEGMAARVIVDRGLANVDIDHGWEKSGNDYSTNGDGPRLTINVNLGAGNLELSTTR
jgi:hypothetical protein